MKKTFIGILSASLIGLFTTSALAGKIFSHEYGQWELMAWKSNTGNADFCALKTYFGNDKTISLRKNSGGMWLVVSDNNFYFNRYYQDVDIYFNGQRYGQYTGESYDSTPNQVFIPINNQWAFLEQFQGSYDMNIIAPELEYEIGLSGTRLLGNYLDACVNTYGF